MVGDTGTGGNGLNSIPTVFGSAFVSAGACVANVRPPTS